MERLKATAKFDQKEATLTVQDVIMGWAWEHREEHGYSVRKGQAATSADAKQMALDSWVMHADAPLRACSEVVWEVDE